MIEKLCEGCGDPFLAGRSNKRFCSRRCISNARYRRLHALPVTEKLCAAGCGRVILSTGRKWFCSTLCRKRVARISRYNITAKRYLEILDSQGGACAICRSSNPGGRGEWLIDHDHSCCPGQTSCGACVRGLLCHGCNAGLGMFQDDQTRLIAASQFLRRHRGQEQTTPSSLPAFVYRFPEGIWDDLREELRAVIGQ